MTVLAVRAIRSSTYRWLRQGVPDRWDVKRLKYCARLINEKVNGRDSELPYTGLEHVESWTGRRLASDDRNAGDGQASRFRSGDVLFGKLRPYLAKVLRATEEGVCTGELLVLRPRVVLQEFLFYFMLAPDFVHVIDASTYGAKMPRASWDFIGNLPVLVPPRDEQRAIAAFLDRETARIDALIEKKERQIELLQEKRAAVISHAVTKGLYPNVKMKDSGVEWLGEIPEHWEIKRLKYSADLVNQKVDGAASELPYTGLEHIESWTGKRLTTDAETSSDGQASVHRAGDVLFGKLRPYLAKAYAAQSDGICTGELLVLRPKTLVQGFVRDYLLNPSFISVVDSSTYGAKMPRASWDFIGNLPALVPPLDEQHDIVAFLNGETARIDALVERIRESIDLLREYRIALISAAVTGKIDVRLPAASRDAAQAGKEVA